MSLEKAGKLISIAKETQADFLDLGMLGLFQLPSELFELKYLVGLNLGSRYWKDGEWIKSRNKGTHNILKHIPYRIKNLGSLEDLHLHGVYGVDIFSLRELRQLRVLDLSFNYDIRDYSVIGLLRRLHTLRLNSNRLRDLSFLAHLRKLITLDLSFNHLPDISFLQRHPQLTYLHLQDCDLKSIASLRELSELDVLDISTNGLLDISPLNRLGKLTRLGMGDMGLRNIGVVGELGNLVSLNLKRNQIKDITSLHKLLHLESLNLRENQIEEVDVLEKSTSLSSLDISCNKVENISSFQPLASLTHLDISRNPIQNHSLFTTHFPNMVSLSMRENRLQNLDFLKNHPPLQNLDVRWNQITTLPQELINWNTPILYGLGKGINLYGNPIKP